MTIATITIEITDFSFFWWAFAAVLCTHIYCSHRYGVSNSNSCNEEEEDKETEDDKEPLPSGRELQERVVGSTPLQQQEEELKTRKRRGEVE